MLQHGSPWAAGKYLLHHHSSRRMQGNTCSVTAHFVPFFLPPGCSQGCLSHLFSSHCCVLYSPFLNIYFHRVPDWGAQMWVQRVCGISWNYGPHGASPLLFSYPTTLQPHHYQHPDTHTQCTSLPANRLLPYITSDYSIPQSPKART